MEQKDQFKRQIAVKLWIKDLNTGQYIKEEGLRPNYVILKDNRKVSRVNVLGTVVSASTDSGYRNVHIDDGTGKVSIRSFEQNKVLDSLEPGDIIFVIGRPREYGREIYILPEIIKPVADKRWIDVRVLELKKNQPPASDNMPGPEPKKESPVVEEFIDQDGSAQKLLECIKELDSGSGADYEEVVSKAELENAEKTLLSLMKNGEVFEVSPGKLKVLE